MAGDVLTKDDAIGTSDAVLSCQKWASNADLIADCARLGYLGQDRRTLDPTYGYGTFWKKFRPDVLIAHDIDPAKSPTGHSVDATALPYDNRTFDDVVIDGPYKLTGTPQNTGGIDERFGVHEPAVPWQDRMALLMAMMTEGARVLDDGFLLFKCQDQVVSGKIRWQTIEAVKHAATLGLGLVDRFDFLSYRPQPAGRRQVHARRNYSTMLAFKRGWES